MVISISGVYAATIISSINVEYNNENSKLVANNVQEAIDEVYDKSFNKDLITAYEYSEQDPKCINGEEKTCVKTDCYKKGKTCSQGTVIKYYVNNHEFYYFYVLRDDGTKITMQQRENTIRNIAWYAEKQDNSKGPATVLLALEQATSTWVNVNIIEYTPGITTLYENAYTGCTYTASETSDYKIRCETNTYTNSVLGTRKARARMITALEAGSTGCLVFKDGATDSRILGTSMNAYNQGSCPDWMYNYLYQSKDCGGSYNNDTVNENEIYDYAYWTMSADSGPTNAWYVNRRGQLSNGTHTSDTGNSARAVVEITKPVKLRDNVTNNDGCLFLVESSRK